MIKILNYFQFNPQGWFSQTEFWPKFHLEKKISIESDFYFILGCEVRNNRPQFFTKLVWM